MSKKNVQKISFVNWLITLIFSIIPGLNLVFFLFTMCCARNPSKKSYAVAAFVLTLIILIGLGVLLFGFGENVAAWATELLDKIPKAVE